MSEIQKAILSLNNRLEQIGDEHEELYDTEPRTCLHITLDYYFVWGSDSQQMPIKYDMFSAKGNKAVAEAVRKFVKVAVPIADRLGIAIGQAREDCLQDLSLTTKVGRQYFDLIGYVKKAQLPERPDDRYFQVE